MSANITINPGLTTNASGSFNVSSVGYIQGVQLDDPAIRYALAGGVLDVNETLPMWGGVGIAEFVAGGGAGYLGSPGGPNGTLGGKIFRATALTGSKALTGFSVFNQAHAMINTPQSQVPLASPGMQVNFLRLGSGARISVKCDAALASLAGADIINTPVAWDFVNQLLIPQITSINVNSGTYTGGSGLVVLTLATPHGLNPGDTVTVAGVTGTGSFAAVNGTFTAGAGTAGSSLHYTIATGLTLTIDASSGTVTTGSALGVKVLDINVGGSMTVTYDGTTGFANWNRSGNTALILI